jgi:pimeloyl-ACP methyl ester carboxylesterase
MAPFAGELPVRYFDVESADGTVLRAWTNDAEGPTVLLCNGLGTNPYTWPALLQADCGVRIVSWNHRGTGGTERPADRNRVGIPEFMEDALAVLDHDGIESAAVMGWSMGVNTAFELALHHPHRVRGIFAVAGVPGGTFSSMFAPLRVPRPIRKPLIVGVASVVSKIGGPIAPLQARLKVGPVSSKVLRHSGFMLPAAESTIVQRAVTEFVHTPIDWYMHLATHSSKHDRVSLSKISAPTSFVAGKYDLLASAEDMRTASERLEGSTYVELVGSHFIPMEQPKVVHSQLLDFLRELDVLHV